MGIYSEVMNCCGDLGQEYIGYLQTKDFEGVFDMYWISPDGCLFKIHWPPLRHDGSLGFQPLMPGQKPRGRISPCRFTGVVRLTGGPGASFAKRPAWFLSGHLVHRGTSAGIDRLLDTDWVAS